MDFTPLYRAAGATGAQVSLTVSVPLTHPDRPRQTLLPTDPPFPGPDVYAHNKDCTAVWWMGQLYRFDQVQGIIVAALIDAYEDGLEWMTDSQLRELADVQRSPIVIMRNSKAWGEWIVSGRTVGGPADSLTLKA